MKIIDVPQSGKIGIQVAIPSRYGQCRRIWGPGSNPNTVAQSGVRANFLSQLRAFTALTEAQQNAWIAAAALEQTRGKLGQSGPMTGLQLYLMLNCARLAIGGTVTATVPAKPATDNLPIDALNITNTGGTIALKLHTTASPPDGTMLWGAVPQLSSRRSTPAMVLLGTTGSPIASEITITSAYTGRFGVPTVGSRIFVACNTNQDGWEGVRRTWTALVPAET